MVKTTTFFLLIFWTGIYDNAAKSVEINIAEDLITSIKAAEKAMSLYNKELDHSIPWKDLNTTIEAIGIDFEHYSTAAQDFIPTIRRHLSNGLQKYFEASQKVYEWTVYATPTLSVYLDTIDVKELVIDVLDDGVIKIGDSITKLDDVVKEFSVAHNKFLSLSDQLKVDFTKNSGYYNDQIVSARTSYYAGGAVITVVGGFMGGIIGFIAGGALGGGVGAAPGALLGGKVGASAAGAVLTGLGIAGAAVAITENEVAEFQGRLNFIDQFYRNSTRRVELAKNSTTSTKEAIKEEQKKMVLLKGTTQVTRTFVLRLTEEQRAIVVQYVRKLIEQCNEFRRRHGGHD